MTANDRQVGGTHYAVPNGGVSHWDYCVEAEVTNLEYAASKYVSRWRKKNGLIDLEKAVHYLEKRIESVNQGIGVKRGVNKRESLFNRFIKDNNIPQRERVVIDNIVHWRRIDQLYEAHATLCEIIREYKGVREAKPTEQFVDDAPCDYNPDQDR